MPGPGSGPTDDYLTNAAISAAMAEERLYGDSPSSGYRDGNVLTVHSDGILRWSDGDPYDPPYNYSGDWESWRSAIASLREPWEDRPAAADFYDQTGSLRTAAELLRPGTDVEDEGTDTVIQGGGKLRDVINTLTGDLSGMEGNTIYTFRANYADRLHTINEGQFALAYVLGECIAAEAEIWNGANIDYNELLGQGAKAFWAARDYQTFGSTGGGGDYSTELKVAGAILSGISLFATGGLSTVVGIGSLGVGLIKDFAPKGDAPKPKITGGTANEVLASLSKALDELRDEITKQEDAIRECLEKNLGVVNGSRRLFDLKSPPILDMDVPTQIGFKVDSGRMRRCGNRTCPKVAAGFTDAANAAKGAAGAGSWTRPAYFGATTGPYPAFADLLAELEYAAENTGYEITKAGGLLALSGDYFDDSDHNAKEALAKLQKLVRTYDDDYPDKPDYDPQPSVVDGWAMSINGPH